MDTNNSVNSSVSIKNFDQISNQYKNCLNVLDQKVQEKMVVIGNLQHAGNVQEQIQNKTFTGMKANEKDTQRRKNEMEGKIEKSKPVEMTLEQSMLIEKMMYEKIIAERKIAKQNEGFFSNLVNNIQEAFATDEKKPVPSNNQPNKPQKMQPMKTQPLPENKDSKMIDLSRDYEELKQFKSILLSSTPGEKNFEGMMNVEQEKISKLETEIQDIVNELKKNEDVNLNVGLNKLLLEKTIELKYAEAEFIAVYVNSVESIISKMEILKKIDPSMDKEITKMKKFSDSLKEIYNNLVQEKEVAIEKLELLNEDNWNSFASGIKGLFEDSKKLEQKIKLNKELSLLMSKIENNEEVSPSELEVLEKLLKQSGLLEDMSTLNQKLTNFAHEHQNWTRVLTTVPSVAVGFLVGGPVGAFAAKMLTDKALNAYFPESKPEGFWGKLGMGAIETASSLIVGPFAALATAVAKTVQHTTSENVQNTLTSVSVGIVANQLGGSLATSVGAGALVGFLSARPGMLSSIGKDFKHTWKNLKERKIWNVVKGVFLFVPKQILENFVGIKRAFTKIDGKRDYAQAIVRIATIVLTAGLVAASFWALPMSIAIFYLVNKAYTEKRVKYTGLATFGNENFRKYVAEKMNRKYNDKGISKIETLKAIFVKKGLTAYNKYLEKKNESVEVVEVK